MGKIKTSWDTRYHIALQLFTSLEYMETKHPECLEKMCTGLRNPVVFDNDLKSSISYLDYTVESPDGLKMTYDHLIGCSNIIKYIFKHRLYKNWKNGEDFKNCLLSLNVKLKVPKKLNDKKSFKEWNFPLSNIDQCLRWNLKLKREGIEYLLKDNGEKVLVDDVYNEWKKEILNLQKEINDNIPIAPKMNFIENVEKFTNNEENHSIQESLIEVSSRDDIDIIYRRKIKEWKENQIKLNKSNLVPGEGTRNRIRKEAMLELS